MVSSAGCGSSAETTTSSAPPATSTEAKGAPAPTVTKASHTFSGAVLHVEEELIDDKNKLAIDLGL